MVWLIDLPKHREIHLIPIDHDFGITLHKLCDSSMTKEDSVNARLATTGKFEHGHIGSIGARYRVIRQYPMVCWTEPLISNVTWRIIFVQALY